MFSFTLKILTVLPLNYTIGILFMNMAPSPFWSKCPRKQSIKQKFVQNVQYHMWEQVWGKRKWDWEGMTANTRGCITELATTPYSLTTESSVCGTSREKWKYIPIPVPHWSKMWPTRHQLPPTTPHFRIMFKWALSKSWGSSHFSSTREALGKIGGRHLTQHRQRHSVSYSGWQQ